MKDVFDRDWITENSIEICQRYDYGVLTLRALHYQLVSVGMTNSVQHYKRVVGAMIKARREGIIRYEQFSDHDREVSGETEFLFTELEESISVAKQQIQNWMKYFNRNRWERQPFIPEIWIEKKALQGVFMPICRDKSVALAPCKGYPSLTFISDAAKRFRKVQENGQTPVIVYFGDYDASGEDIPRSVHDNLLNDFDCYVEVKRIALMEHQVIEMNLPPAPTKDTDSRAANWDGLGQVELDAVNPDILQDMCREALDDIFDEDIFEQLEAETAEDIKVYQRELRNFVNEI